MKRGDTLVTGLPLYKHYGIFLGNDMVAEIGGNNKRNLQPQIVSYGAFTHYGKREAYIVSGHLPCMKRLLSEDVAQCAEFIVNNPSLWGHQTIHECVQERFPDVRTKYGKHLR
ncbi:hypothetical protein DPMN_137118, partial [Dreissena polymorpha]